MVRRFKGPLCALSNQNCLIGRSPKFCENTLLTKDNRRRGENKTKLIKPLGLSDKEIGDLVAFVEAFSGPEIKIDRPKLPPYAPLPDVVEAQ